MPPQQKKERAGVVIATTALLWCTEAMPLMITALMPAILFPFAGVLDTKEVSAVYWNVSFHSDYTSFQSCIKHEHST